MSVFLTSNGRNLLNQKIQAVQERLKAVMSQKGDAYENGGNGWHDNFSFEQLVREEAMLAGELTSLNSILKDAVLVSPIAATATEVGVGCIIVLEDEDGGVAEYEVAGYGESNTAASPKKLEYLAPLIHPFMGGVIGDEHTLRIGGRKVTLTLTHIRSN